VRSARTARAPPAAGKTTTRWVTVTRFQCKEYASSSRTQPGSVAACQATCSGGCPGVWYSNGYCFKCTDAAKGSASSSRTLYQRPLTRATVASQCNNCKSAGPIGSYKASANSCPFCPAGKPSVAGTTTVAS